MPKRSKGSVSKLALTVSTSAPTVMLRQEISCTESCLPETMSIAEQSKDLLAPLLRYSPRAWSFGDMVLVLLAPDFRADIRRHYLNTGPTMMNMFDSNQIEDLDKLLA